MQSLATLTYGPGNNTLVISISPNPYIKTGVVPLPVQYFYCSVRSFRCSLFFSCRYST
uniref:Uncharacterized protein n=1 Tax=Clostridium perfringens TaxID=1502 RepID=F7J0B4_CLOPF|nr:hypothetical protein [Clostridium perfringens]